MGQTDESLTLAPTQAAPASHDRATTGRPGWAWVPIRSLSPRHRARIAEHLLELSTADRYLRFGYPATDAHIGKYVDMLDFERDEVFGIFNRRLNLIAMAHLAHAQEAAHSGAGRIAEFGVSVSPKARGRGYGARLFERAVLHARNRGVASLFIHALSENIAMLKIVRNAGATIERNGSESEAWLKLPPLTMVTRVGEMVEEQAAEIDYQFKLQAQRVNEFLDVVHEVTTHMREKSLNASE
jgi:GNAT superfamily N-acetyltransferase